jgi:hypothetical protein
MPKLNVLEKAQKKLELEAKREAKKLAKEEKEKKKASEEAAKSISNSSNAKNDGAEASSNNNGNNDDDGDNDVTPKECLLLQLPHVTIHHILSCLPSRDIGILTMTCRFFAEELVDGRIPILMSRLHRIDDDSLLLPSSSSSLSRSRGVVGCINLCSSPTEAQEILQQSYGGGNTGRINGNKGKKYNPLYVNEFVSYARFLEEAVCGYATLSPSSSSERRPLPRNNNDNISSDVHRPLVLLPPFCNGRFVSVSPEHSLTRIGGGGTASGAGGSGVASWGVGKRGQLGHGKRKDESQPKLLLGGIGYGIRIVQVSAGGGLVRVAHSLLLTSNGRVLSFGTGHYGALGHGYSAGKQLPDHLRPKYITALAGVQCVCVAAGELHSAVVTTDGDVYTWGDGFCGQLGHADKRPQPTPQQVTRGGLDEECVLSVTCGARHTIAITEEGEVFTWGLGHFGVLGRVSNCLPACLVVQCFLSACCVVYCNLFW